jgi:hypothetical protein
MLNICCFILSTYSITRVMLVTLESIYGLNAKVPVFMPKCVNRRLASGSVVTIGQAHIPIPHFIYFGKSIHS